MISRHSATYTVSPAVTLLRLLLLTNDVIRDVFLLSGFMGTVRWGLHTHPAVAASFALSTVGQYQHLVCLV